MNLLDYLFTPFFKFYFLLVKFVAFKLGYKLLPNNTTEEISYNKKFISYIFETPYLIKNKANLPFEELEGNTIYFQDDDLSHNFETLKEFSSLDDRFTSCPNQLNLISKRSEKILIFKTKKSHFPGHKLREEIYKKALKRKEFAAYDLSKLKINDLYKLFIKYKFAVVLENTDSEYYFCEKFYDPIKAGTIPIYHNKTNKDFKYIRIEFDKLNDLDLIIKKVNNFKKTYKFENVAKKNFEELIKMRKYHKLQFLKYQSLPNFVFAKTLHWKSPLYYLFIKLLDFKNIFGK